MPVAIAKAGAQTSSPPPSGGQGPATESDKDAEAADTLARLEKQDKFDGKVPAH